MHLKLIAAAFVSLLISSSIPIAVEFSDSADADLIELDEREKAAMTITCYESETPTWMDEGLIRENWGYYIINGTPEPTVTGNPPEQFQLIASEDFFGGLETIVDNGTEYTASFTGPVPQGHYVFDVCGVNGIYIGWEKGVGDFRFDLTVLPDPILATGSFEDVTVQEGSEYRLAFSLVDGTTLDFSGADFLKLDANEISGTVGAPGEYALSLHATKDPFDETHTWKMTVTPEAVPPTISMAVRDLGDGTYIFTAQSSDGAVTWTLGDDTIVSKNSVSVSHTFESGVFNVKVTVVNDNDESASDEYVVINHDERPSDVAYSTVEYRYSPDLGEFTDIPAVSMPDLENPFLLWDDATKTVIGTPPVALVGKTYHAILQFGEEKTEWDIQILAASSVIPTASFLCSVEDLSVSFTPVTNVEIGSSLYKWVVTDVHGNNIVVSNDRDFSFTAETSGMYYVTLTITNVKGDASSSQTVELMEAAAEEDDDDKETEFDPFDKENWDALLDKGYVILSSADTEKIIVVVVLAVVCILIGAVIAYRPKHGKSHKVRSSGHRRNSR